MRSAPQGQGIRPVLRAAVEMKWQETRQLAAALLGDDSLASEMTEAAVERTVKYLAGRPPLGTEETAVVFMRFYRQEVRRRRAAHARLSLRGSTVELPAPLVRLHSALDSRLDLESMLRTTSPELRTALLLRYGANERWSEVAEYAGTSKDAIRKSCKREIDRIRKQLLQLDLAADRAKLRAKKRKAE